MESPAAALLTRGARSARLRGLYALVGEGRASALDAGTAALAAGVRVIQYRRKTGIDAAELRELRTLTQAHGALFLLNDDWRSAQAFACDGVHLGPDDDGFADPQRVRAAFPDGMIGLSCGDVAQARAADAHTIDYVGVGPVFATASKTDAGEPLGVEGLLAIAAATPLPVCAIGGIAAENLRAVRRSGVAMAAVISAICNAAEPALAAEWLLRIWRDETP